MGLLEQIYSVFSLGYFIALTILKHEDFSGADKAFIAATAAFVVLSILRFLNQLRVIPWGYKWRFTGKSLLRGLLGPLLSLFYYHVLFCCSSCVKKALTFSNEAHDGVERTRQLQKFELVQINSDAPHCLGTHDLLRYVEEKKWGYDRLVGELWVRVRFEDLHIDNTVQFMKLETSAEGMTRGMTSLLQYQRAANVQEQPNNPVHESVKISCLECIRGDLERGRISAFPGTPATQTEPENQAPRRYRVTITRRRAICRIQRDGCWLCPGCTVRGI